MLEAVLVDGLDENLNELPPGLRLFRHLADGIGINLHVEARQHPDVDAGGLLSRAEPVGKVNDDVEGEAQVGVVKPNSNLEKLNR